MAELQAPLFGAEGYRGDAVRLAAAQRDRPDQGERRLQGVPDDVPRGEGVGNGRLPAALLPAPELRPRAALPERGDAPGAAADREQLERGDRHERDQAGRKCWREMFR